MIIIVKSLETIENLFKCSECRFIHLNINSKEAKHNQLFIVASKCIGNRHLL